MIVLKGFIALLVGTIELIGLAYVFNLPVPSAIESIYDIYILDYHVLLPWVWKGVLIVSGLFTLAMMYGVVWLMSKKQTHELAILPWYVMHFTLIIMLLFVQITYRLELCSLKIIEWCDTPLAYGLWIWLILSLFIVGLIIQDLENHHFGSDVQCPHRAADCP